MLTNTNKQYLIERFENDLNCNIIEWSENGKVSTDTYGIMDFKEKSYGYILENGKRNSIVSHDSMKLNNVFTPKLDDSFFTE